MLGVTSLNVTSLVATPQVQERVRKRGETAIGYLEETGPLRLAPGALQRHTFGGGDRLIIVGQGATQLAHQHD